MTNKTALVRACERLDGLELNLPGMKSGLVAIRKTEFDRIRRLTAMCLEDEASKVEAVRRDGGRDA